MAMEVEPQGEVNEAGVGHTRKRDESSSAKLNGTSKSRKVNEDYSPLLVRIKSAESYSTNRAPIAFQQPTSIATFSYDESRELFHDDRSRRYYHAPPPKADLNRGFEAFIERDDSINEHLDSLLLSLMRMSEEDKDEHRMKAQVITWRGMMTKFCTLLYEDRQGFDMNAMMIGDTLYLEEHVGPNQRADKSKQQQDPRLKKFGYYGYSFASWTCSKDADPDTLWDGDVNTNVQWCSIVKTKLGDTRCILAGEVDAVDVISQTPIEVKTSMQIRNSRDEERFESKMLRFYMQSFLLGVAKVIVGFRDQRGVLLTHQEFQTLAMPRLVRGKPHAWDPIACLNLASELITSIRSYILSTSSKQLPPLAETEKSKGYPVYRISFNHTLKELTVTKLDSDIILHEVKGGKEEGRVGFLLSSYYDMVIKSL